MPPQIYLCEWQKNQYCKEIKAMVWFWNDLLNLAESKLNIENNESFAENFPNLYKIAGEKYLYEWGCYTYYEYLCGQALNGILQYFDQQVRTFLLKEIQSDWLIIVGKGKEENSKQGLIILLWYK